MKKLLLSTIICLGSAAFATAQKAPAGAAVCPDDNDAELRLNPELAPVPAPKYDAVSYSPYPFVATDSNHIALNGADWSGLCAKAADTGNRALRIVLLGDSHIQADGATSVTRRLLQSRYGTAGRGLVTPLKLVGSNQPSDYRLTSATPGWATARLMKRPWASDMLFTGVSATPPAGKFDLRLELTGVSAGERFSTVSLYYGGKKPQLEGVTTLAGENMEFTANDNTPGCLTIALDRPEGGCELQMASEGDTRIGGLRLTGADSGVEFTTIGNNGAAFQSYLGLETGKGVATMNPDLIILAMGANDAWGNMTDQQFVSSVDRLVSELQEANTGAQVLLTTPAEAQKRQGKKGGYAPHAKIKHFRDLLLQYGRDHKVATWDFYEIAGGDGSSYPWNEAKLFSRDKIHLSWDGYTLMGQLLGEALAESLSKPDEK